MTEAVALVSLKCWKIDRAAELGITVESLEGRMARGQHPRPAERRINQRVILVDTSIPLPPMPPPRRNGRPPKHRDA